MQRFWDKVDTSGDCWEWQASTRGKGTGDTSYGAFRFDGKIILAHRFAYSLVFGNIPDGLCVCHHCDNPLCVNPSHLFLGVQKDNIQDAIAKGRFNTRGENCGMSRLCENDVHEIRRLRSLGVKQPLLAKMWRIGHTNVSYIINRRRWRHI